MKARIWGMLLMIVMLFCACPGQGEERNMTDTDWYRQAVKDSEMNLGANARLKNIIGRAESGEVVTIATIGGSITEGAGAKTYPECWAALLRDQFGATFGTDGGSNVRLVNAGVGGTPSPFGYMRYGREILGRVPEDDSDSLPDVVVIEFSVNDWQEPTGHRCYESMVKEILEAPNEPAVILLFAVFRDGFNLQDDLRKIGDRYGLMMVSIKDGLFGHIGKELTSEEFFYDQYHPTSLGHRIMADCLMGAIQDAAEADGNGGPVLEAAPVFGTDFMGLKTVFGDEVPDGFSVDRGGFRGSDLNSYRNHPVGWVCGRNFFHDIADPMDPLRITGVFRKCLVAWKASNDKLFGAAEILVDGKVVMTVQGSEGKWGQSEVVLALDDTEAAEHTLEIRLTEAGKRFTVTAVSFQ